MSDQAEENAMWEIGNLQRLQAKLEHTEARVKELEDLVSNRARIFTNQSSWCDADSAVVAEGRAILAARDKETNRG
jgi:ferritin-like metal-binding protein YciE